MTRFWQRVQLELPPTNPDEPGEEATLLLHFEGTPGIPESGSTPDTYDPGDDAEINFLEIYRVFPGGMKVLLTPSEFPALFGEVARYINENQQTLSELLADFAAEDY